jgi:hypothetical protein
MTADAETIRPDGANPYCTPDFGNNQPPWRNTETMQPIFPYFGIIDILYPSEPPTARHVP